jgi:hypothetical protein
MTDHLRHGLNFDSIIVLPTNANWKRDVRIVFVQTIHFPIGVSEEDNASPLHVRHSWAFTYFSSTLISCITGMHCPLSLGDQELNRTRKSNHSYICNKAYRAVG